MIKSNLSVILGDGLPHKKVLLRVEHLCTKKIYYIQGVRQETKHFSQHMQLSLITVLIVFIDEVFFGLVNK